MMGGHDYGDRLEWIFPVELEDVGAEPRKGGRSGTHAGSVHRSVRVAREPIAGAEGRMAPGHASNSIAGWSSVSLDACDLTVGVMSPRSPYAAPKRSSVRQASRRALCGRWSREKLRRGPPPSRPRGPGPVHQPPRDPSGSRPPCTRPTPPPHRAYSPTYCP